MAKIKYLNTDLDLIASRDPHRLVTALKSAGLVHLHTRKEQGKWAASFETEVAYKKPELTFRALLRAIESLDGHAKEIWELCRSREFNIGYDSGDHPWAFENELSNKTLRRVANLDISIAITLYPPEDRETRK